MHTEPVELGTIEFDHGGRSWTIELFFDTVWASVTADDDIDGAEWAGTSGTRGSVQVSMSM